MLSQNPPCPSPCPAPPPPRPPFLLHQVPGPHHHLRICGGRGSHGGRCTLQRRRAAHRGRPAGSHQGPGPGGLCGPALWLAHRQVWPHPVPDGGAARGWRPRCPGRARVQLRPRPAVPPRRARGRIPNVQASGCATPGPSPRVCVPVCVPHGHIGSSAPPSFAIYTLLFLVLVAFGGQGKRVCVCVEERRSFHCRCCSRPAAKAHGM